MPHNAGNPVYHIPQPRDNFKITKDDASIITGACFLDKISGWSSFHYVQSGAITHGIDLPNLRFTNCAEPSLDVHSAAAQLAGAVCKLYLNWRLNAGGTSEMERMELSGFWISHKGKKYILSCSHVLPDELTAIESFRWKENASENVRVRLYKYGKPSDISLFEMYDEDQQKTTQLPTEYLTVDKLDVIPLLPRDGLQCFVAGYNGRNQPLAELTPTQIEILRSVNPKTYDGMMRDPRVQTKFHYIMDNYLLGMSQSQTGRSLVSFFTGRKLNFADTFKPKTIELLL
ncbi:MAG: hypothetical protein Q9221_004661 [Calogaya cf. arnoldii]